MRCLLARAELARAGGHHHIHYVEKVSNPLIYVYVYVCMNVIPTINVPLLCPQKSVVIPSMPPECMYINERIKSLTYNECSVVMPYSYGSCCDICFCPNLGSAARDNGSLMARGRPAFQLVSPATAATAAVTMAARCAAIINNMRVEIRRGKSRGDGICTEKKKDIWMDQQLNLE